MTQQVAKAKATLKCPNLSIDSENYADTAEEVVRRNKRGDKLFDGLTTSKIRSIYGLIMNIYTKVIKPEDFDGHRSDLQYLKVKMAYEAGREQSVAKFLKESCLRDLVAGIKSYEQFMLYCRYAESLVAYFKFYGGKD